MMPRAEAGRGIGAAMGKANRLTSPAPLGLACLGKPSPIATGLRSGATEAFNGKSGAFKA